MNTRKQLLRIVAVIGAVVFLLSDAKAVAAAGGCFAQLKECYGSAAGKMDWVDMWLAGLDCELTFTDCTRRAIIGR